MTDGTSFVEFAQLCKALEETRKRNAKKDLISSFLSKLRGEEIQPAVSFLTGNVFPESDPRVLEVGYKTLQRALRGRRQRILTGGRLTILSVKAYFEAVASITGKDSRRRKVQAIQNLFERAEPFETEYLMRILMREMRVGAVEGVILTSISETAGLPLHLIRRGNMLLGNIGEVAKIAIREGKESFMKIDIRLFTPIKPMLAAMTYDLNEVFESHGGETAFEYKFDGARIQIHIDNQKVRIFSRRLSDVTQSLPDVVKIAKEKIEAEQVLLEGEVVAIDDFGKVLPFQDLMRRFRRIHNVEVMTKVIPLTLHLFDILYLNGQTLIDIPYEGRRDILNRICDSALLAERIITGNLSTAKGFLDTAMRAGHEGLMAKAVNSTYTPGVRGNKWFKIKPYETLDLVITAADWGYGRRTGWLSNYHLAVRDDETGKFLDVGKTFKGLTDNEFKEMTRRLRQIKASEGQYTIYVKPRIVVEVAFNEVQKSSHYNSGFALRFARVTRIRYDKSPDEADTLRRLSKLYEDQFRFKGRIRHK